MTNATKRRVGIVANIIAIIVCLTMLMSTTFAWFTDSEISNGNVIKSGVLNVEAYWAEGTTDPANTTWNNLDEGAVFNYDNWKPGYTVARHVKISNEGSLAFKYKLVISPNGEVSDLAEVIDVYYVDTAVQIASRDMISSEYLVGTLADLIADPDGAAYGVLLPASATTVNNANEVIGETTATVVFKMQETAGNEYAGKSIGTDFDIQVIATQYAYEEDDLGADYDENVEYPFFVKDTAALTDAINSGKPATLLSDVKYNQAIVNDATINLNGNTFEATNTIKLTNNSDLAMKGGDYEVNSTFGHVDVRPSTAEGSVVVFEDVDFSFNKLNRTYGPSTNRLGSVVEVCAEVTGAKTEIVFKNCTFDNAQVVIEGMSGKTGEVVATFENCTFNALTSSAPIYVQNYVTATINVIGCTFDLECTSSSASAISISSSNSTSVTLTAKGNTFNATAATPYTYDASKGEDETYNVKVNGTPANIKFISAGANSTVIESGTVKTGIAAK